MGSPIASRLLRMMAVILGAALLVSCDTRPAEVGVFLNTGKGWTKLPSYEWESFSGGYNETEGLSPESLPVAIPGTKILINKVPIDPSAVYWGRNVHPDIRIGGKWRTRIDTQPASVVSVDQGVYEISTNGLDGGVFALEAKGGGLSMRAYFFRIASEVEQAKDKAARAAADRERQAAQRERQAAQATAAAAERERTVALAKKIKEAEEDAARVRKQTEELLQTPRPPESPDPRHCAVCPECAACRTPSAALP